MDVALLIIGIIIVILQLVILLYKSKTAKVNNDKSFDTDKLTETVLNEAKDIKNSFTIASTASFSALFQGVQATNEQVLLRVKEANDINASKIFEVKEELSKSLYDIRKELKSTLEDVRRDNNVQLEAMRGVVDEKLSNTLNERLTQSFNIISERLESVSKGLGEMQSLAGGVNDLKKVLTNVKTRGTWGEVSLEGILDDILTHEQYEKNCNVSERGDKQRVDFAVVLPGQNNEKLYLPIDVKFPLEDYQRLSEEKEGFDSENYKTNLSKLIVRIKQEAAKINEKYIKPPKTTDFAIMYLPVEGLYAEVLRQNGLAEELQNYYKVIPCGPTNIAAMLSAIRMGFKTLTIQKYSKEIFEILASFKKEFVRFSEIVFKAQGQLNTATKSLEEAGRKTEAISKKLSKIDDIGFFEEREITMIDNI